MVCVCVITEPTAWGTFTWYIQEPVMLPWEVWVFPTAKRKPRFVKGWGRGGALLQPPKVDCPLLRWCLGLVWPYHLS